ncbi:MAG TPA: hypothetical protein VKU60_04545, partial [Chloroflexota bacterium]|nr:hypothetical protein [Chloroflexota bacterium]
MSTAGVTTSAIFSNDLLWLVKYPNPSTGAASSSASDQNSFTYNAAGETLTKTDQNDNTHTYTYDVLGRVTSDATSIYAHIDTTYNSQGLPDTTSVYSGGTLINQVEDFYNGLGQLTSEYQSHSGAVSTSGGAISPYVSYAYDTSAHGSRISSMTYPDGRVIGYVYDTGLDADISRLSSISNNGDTLESYTYLGLGTVVVRANPTSTLTLVSSGTSDSGDHYTGLDRFGRVIDQLWLSGGTTDEFQYTYDANSNVTAKTSMVNDGTSGDYNEAYSYDNLNRLTGYSRGGTAAGSYTLDAVGNQAAANSLNELTGGSISYDSNGNTTNDGGGGHTFDYNAWNQMVAASNGTLSETFVYDGFGRRISTTQPDATTFYYSSQGQVLEETADDNMFDYIWSPVYVDALIERVAVNYGVVTADQGTGDGGGEYTTGLVMTQAALDNRGGVLIAGQLTGIDDTTRIFIERFTAGGRDYSFGGVNDAPISGYDYTIAGLMILPSDSGTLTGISVESDGTIDLSYTDFSGTAPDMSGYGSGIAVVATNADSDGTFVQALQGPSTDVYLIKYSNGGGLHFDTGIGVVDTGLTSFGGLSVDPATEEISVISGSTAYYFTPSIVADGTGAAPAEPDGGIVASGGVVIGTFVTP